MTAPILAFLFTLPLVSSFTAGIEMAILSIYHCNYIDEEMHVGEQRYADAETAALMGYYSSKIKANALDSSAKGKKTDMGELVNGDEMYEVLKEEEEDYTPPPSSDESDDKDDLFNEN